MSSPILLTLYGPNDEVLKTLQRSIVPWGILKKALRLAKNADLENPTEETIDELGGLIAGLFGDQVTLKELEDGSDMGEMISVLQQIMGRAQVLMPAGNPTIPAK